MAGAGSGAACAQTDTGRGYEVDSQFSSPNQDSRVRTLVLHYTVVGFDSSLSKLTDSAAQVSAHYLVPDGDAVSTVYQLVPEDRRAWHAGRSYWQGDRMLNACSVGIEIVNSGFPEADQSLPPMQRRWAPYGEAQLVAVGRLAADIVARHQIRPHKIVGHSDVSPGRKLDPGPLFPWERLYCEYQIGAWPEAEAVAYYLGTRAFDGDVASLQSRLLAYGYDTPQTGTMDAQTANVVSAFQMHFRPRNYDGVPDAETVAILDALLEKYFNVGRTTGAAKSAPSSALEQPGHDIGEKGFDVWPMPDSR